MTDCLLIPGGSSRNVTKLNIAKCIPVVSLGSYDDKEKFAIFKEASLLIDESEFIFPDKDSLIINASLKIASFLLSS